MKLSLTACIALVAIISKADADCFSTRLGYPCCSSSNVSVESTDSDGQWGIENGNWCGIPSSVVENDSCFSIKLGYPCCSSSNVPVESTDSDGQWGIENGDWCGIPSSVVENDNDSCFSIKLGYPCCSSSNVPVESTDSDGQWGIENGDWCGIPSSNKNKSECTGQDKGFPCCNTCKVQYTDDDGLWGYENNQWCGIKNTCKQTTTTTKKTTTKTTTTTSKTQEPTSGVPLNPPKITDGQTGKTTRYWDCCLASCSWSENTKAIHPVNACDKDGRSVFKNFDYTIGSACSRGRGYMCSNNQPWAVNENVAYGFVAAGFNRGNQKDWCCTCQRLQFTSGPIAGKQMVVQITNTGNDLSDNHFDIQMPGGGVGAYNGCTSQFGAPNDGWGLRYGGVQSISDCSQLPADLQEGCKWRFNWFKNADNPAVTFERVQCPKELTDITGCVPIDDASAKPLPW